MIRKQSMTAEDLLEMPGDGNSYELVRGELRTMTRGGFEHGQIAMRLGSRIGRYVEEHNLGVHCVGAPIFNESHYPVASLWVTGPIDRLKKDQLTSVAEYMLTSARQISIRLGYKDQF